MFIYLYCYYFACFEWCVCALSFVYSECVCSVCVVHTFVHFAAGKDLFDVNIFILFCFYWNRAYDCVCVCVCLQMSVYRNATLFFSLMTCLLFDKFINLIARVHILRYKINITDATNNRPLLSSLNCICGCCCSAQYLYSRPVIV